MTILDYIPTGSENPISRRDLARLLDVPDRMVRGRIMQLRMEGYPICSTSSRAGYYMADSREELEAFCREHESRGSMMILTAERMRAGHAV